MGMPDKNRMGNVERWGRYLLLAAACLLFVGITFAVSVGGNLPSTRLRPYALKTINSDWYQITDGQTVELNQVTEQHPVSSESETVLYRQLPEVTEGDAMMFYNNYQAAAVYVENNCIYDYGYSTKPSVGPILGNVACLIPMKPEYGGQTVSIHLKNPLESIYLAPLLQNVYLDNGNSLILGVILDNAEQFLCALLFVLISMVLLVGYLVECLNKRAYEKKNLLYLGITIFLSAAWIWTDSSFPQLLWENGVAASIASFFLFMMLPIPALGLIGTICPKGRPLFNRLINLSLLNITVQGLLYLGGVMNFVRLLPVTHLLLLVDYVAAIYHLYLETKRTGSGYARGVLAAFGIMLLFSVINLATFYRLPTSDNSRYFRYGFAIFILILFGISFNDLLSFIEEKTEMNLYKKLAYTDLMTKLNNRVAYEEMMTEMRQNEGRERPLTAVILDINNLKLVNDHFGHSAGDEIIKGAAQCIRRVFGKLGQLYRIGGDEFVVLMEKNDLDMEKLPDTLMKEVEQFQETGEYPLSMACGFADNREDAALGAERLLEIADKRMYEHKAMLKKNRQGSYEHEI